MPAPGKRRFTVQIIALVEPEMREQIREFADENGHSISEVVRAAIIMGLPLLSPNSDLPTRMPSKPMTDAEYAEYVAKARG